MVEYCMYLKMSRGTVRWYTRVESTRTKNYIAWSFEFTEISKQKYEPFTTVQRSQQ